MLNPNTEIIAEQLRPLLKRLTRKLRRLSPIGSLLSQGERSVLVLLDEYGKLLSSELAVKEKITPQSMGQLLNHLAELNLIHKTASTTDRRKIYISLSQHGIDMIAKVRSERNEWLSKAITETCTLQEQEILLKAIAPLTKLVEFNG